MCKGARMQGCRPHARLPLARSLQCCAHCARRVPCVGVAAHALRCMCTRQWWRHVLTLLLPSLLPDLLLRCCVPGGQVERALRVLDGAVAVFDAVSGA